MNREFYVYVWYREDDKIPFYVGKGKGNRYSTLHSRNPYFLNVYKKHGGYSVKMHEGLTEDEAFQKEAEIIMEYRELYPLTNLTDGGDGVSGYSHTEKTRKALADLSKKQWSNPDNREKLVKALKASKQTKEFREKISKAHRGKIMSDRNKNAIKEGMKNPVSKAKMAKAKMKYTNIKCLIDEEHTIVFENTRKAVEWLEANGHKGARMSPVIGALTGKNKTSYGYKWTL